MSVPLNPLALTNTEAAALLSKASGKCITEAMIGEAVAAGMPVDPSGKLNLVHMAAWLNREYSAPSAR